MPYEVDQSGKIENTSQKTVIAYSNSSKNALVLTAKDKRKLQELYRRRGMPRLFVIHVFAIAVYLLIKDQLNDRYRFLVDIEYEGYTKVIAEIIECLSGKRANIEWGYIGKSSPAHDYSVSVFKGKVKEYKTATAKEVWVQELNLLRRNERSSFDRKTTS